MDTQVNPKKLFIGNIPYSVSEEQLNELITAHATPESLKLIVDRETGRFRGIAFAEFPTEADAQAVVAGLNDMEVDGRKLRVNVAQPKAPRRDFGSNGGGYRGGNGGYRGGNDRRF